MEQIGTGYWDFIMTYLPYYYSDDRVLRSDILFRYINNEDVNVEDICMIQKEYPTRQDVINELRRIDWMLLHEAIDAFKEQYK